MPRYREQVRTAFENPRRKRPAVNATNTERLRVVLVSKALVVGIYQRKAEEIAVQGIDLTVLTPPAWHDRRGGQALEHAHTNGYALRAIPLRFNGQFHLHYYPTLAQELERICPHLLHMDEEPYNLATWLGLRAAHKRSIPSLFFTWQNINRRYPPPFSWMEQRNYRYAAAAIAGNAEAAQVLRTKGYLGPITTLPQFGVDPQIFAPAPLDEAKPAHAPDGLLHIGYAGGLLPEKGLDTLLQACAGLAGSWQLTLAGEGELQDALTQQAQTLGIGARVRLPGRVPSLDMPRFLRSLHVLVLPSRTTPRWKEQFGRVLIEAMACGVPVIGSDSGEIPHVIGSAGQIFPEGDADALRNCLQRLIHEPQARIVQGEAGRARVEQHFTMRRVAQETVALYRRMIAQTSHQSSPRLPVHRPG